jgi:flagellar protein FlgJ
VFSIRAEPVDRRRMRWFTIVLCLPLLVVTSSVVAAPASAVPPADFIASSVGPAQDSQREFQVPASVTIAQAILESSWGESGLTVNDRNYFGIKCVSPGNPGPIAVGCRAYPTTECQPPPCHPVTAYFRVYNSMTDSYRDHGALLRNASRYAAAFAHTGDPDAFITEVWRAGYATDPNYPDSVIRLMRQYNLYQYDRSRPAGNPLGSVDILAWDADRHALRVAGWSFDPDFLWSKTGIGLWMDNGPLRDLGDTNVQHRPDLNQAYDPVFGTSIGDWHGFDHLVSEVPAGEHWFCVSAGNRADTPGTNVFVGCKTVNVPPNG